MTNGVNPDGVPILLMHDERGDWLEVREVDGDGLQLWPVHGPVAAAARIALGLREDANVGARAFACHPDDLPLWEGAARKFIDRDGFARAFAHDANGDFVINARFKEVSLPTGATVEPLSVALLAAQMQTQALLEQMQIQLADVLDALEYLRQVDGLDLEAEVLGDAALLDDLWETLQKAGTVTETDWNEIQHLGSRLISNHSKVLGRLGFLRQRLEFNTVDGARAAQNVKRRDVQNLFRLEAFVYRALCQHSALSLVMRAQRGEDQQRALERIERLKSQHLRESERERRAYASLDPHASVEMRGLIEKGIFSYRAQRRTIADGQRHVQGIAGTVPTTIVSTPHIKRLRQAESPTRGLESGPAQ